MFIDHDSRDITKAPKERNIWLRLHIALLRSEEVLSGYMSYKHLAALRPGRSPTVKNGFSLRFTGLLLP